MSASRSSLQFTSRRLLPAGLFLLILAGCGGPQSGRSGDGAGIAPPSVQASAQQAAANADAGNPVLPGTAPGSAPAADATPPAAPAPARPSASAAAPADRKTGSPIATPGELDAYARALSAERSLAYPAVLGLLQEARYNATASRLIASAAPQRKVVRAWPVYRQRYVERIRIRDGVAFMQDNADTLARAQARYGVPASVIAAIIGVETLYGRNTGSFRVLDALATLAFHYPMPERADRVQLFRDQLADLIDLHLAGSVDARALQGSFAGAIGVPQFMPGSIKRFAVDADGDGRIDLHGSIPDAVMSVGNFLVLHGWRPGLPVFAPAELPADPAALVNGGLEPTLDWGRLQSAGAKIAPDGSAGPWQNAPLGVINLPDERVGHVEYRTATPNFFALTQYNRSYFYASAVADLAAVLQKRMDDAAGAAPASASASAR